MIILFHEKLTPIFQNKSQEKENVEIGKTFTITITDKILAPGTSKNQKEKISLI